MKPVSSLLNSVREETFPEKGTTLEQWKFLLGRAILAPSFYNSQPWLFRIRYTLLDIYADRRRCAPVADPVGRNLFLSCGCVLFQLECSMRHYGCLGPVELFPDDHPDHFARIHFGSGKGDSLQDPLLFDAIAKRRTCRQTLYEDAIPPELLAELAACAQAAGAWLVCFTEQEVKTTIARLVFEGDKWQWNKPGYRSELSQWVHTNHGTRHDGIPDYALPDDEFFSYPNPLLGRTFEGEESEDSRHRDFASGSPVLAVIGSNGDTPLDWVQAGEALDCVLLRAAASGVFASFLNQPIEAPEFRAQLGALAGHTGFPQVLFRLGYAEPGKPTPRRHLEEMII